MSIVIISFTCCFLQIYDDFYGPFFNDITGGILNDYLHLKDEEQVLLSRTDPLNQNFQKNTLGSEEDFSENYWRRKRANIVYVIIA